ncbi:MAG TPA: hypothetical protein VIJ82_22255 [Streptosporangiaceae bacterium]|jgi:hypothetical protein
MISATELAQITDDERQEPAAMLCAGSGGTAPQACSRRLSPVTLLRICSAACAAFLLAWIIFLGATLPAQAVAHEWRLAWVGLDVAEAAGLLVVTWAARRQREMLLPAAIVTSTLLVCDAWFDVIFSWGTSDWRWSVLSAAAVELPLAALLFTAALHMIRTTVAELSARMGVAGPPPALRQLPLLGPSAAVPEPLRPQPSAVPESTGRRPSPPADSGTDNAVGRHGAAR